MKREVISAIQKRIDHFRKVHHKFEAEALFHAMSMIEMLMPPESLSPSPQPSATAEKPMTAEEILKKCMSVKYCGETRFDYLDEDEKPLIYKAMEEYAALKPVAEREVCPNCGKYKSLQGNGIAHQLCECGAERELPGDEDIKIQFPIIPDDKFTAGKSSSELMHMQIKNSYSHGGRYGAKWMRELIKERSK